MAWHAPAASSEATRRQERVVADKERAANRSWWARNRRWLLWLLALYVLAMLVLYYVSTVPQNQPMTYQLF
jgi:hypothetical protein